MREARQHSIGRGRINRPAGAMENRGDSAHRRCDNVVMVDGPRLDGGDVRTRLCRLVRGDIDSFESEVDWEAPSLWALAESQRLIPLLAERLRARGLLARCPRAVRAPIEEAERREAMHDAAQVRELRIVLARLARAGVRAILLKGVPLAYTHYPKPHTRPRLDVDLLIRHADIGALERVMTDAGFCRLNFVDNEHVTHQIHFEKSWGGTQGHLYDVHWQIAEPALFARLLSYDDIDASAQPVPLLGEHARAPSDVHALFLACLHRVAHHYGADDLIWLYDLHLLASRLSEAEWRALVQLARETRTQAVCARGLAQAAADFGTALPAIARAMPEGADEPTSAFLHGSLRQIDLQILNLRYLRGWRARTRFVAGHLFPPAAYMLNAYRARSRGWLPALYAHRMVRGAARWLRPPEGGASG
jgi:hypothetical protein